MRCEQNIRILQVEKTGIKCQKTELDGPSSKSKSVKLDPHKLFMSQVELRDTLRRSIEVSSVAVLLFISIRSGKILIRQASSPIVRSCRQNVTKEKDVQIQL